MTDPHERNDNAPYELEAGPTPPDLHGQVILRATHHDAIDAMSMDLLTHAHNCVRAFGDFHLCVSGVEAIEPVLLRILTDPVHRDLPWRRTHVWSLAERLDTSADAEYDLIHETLAVHADLPRGQAHAIDTTARSPARDFERELRECLAWREKGHDRLDYVLMAPGSAPEDWSRSAKGEQLVRAYDNRIACTPHLINASRFITVCAFGETARPEIERTLQGKGPLTALDPLGGLLRWCLDEAACP